MREVGRDFDDQGFVEINLVSGTIEWANNFLLDKLGYTLKQFTTMTLFDAVPQEYHDTLRDSIADHQKNHSIKFEILPIGTADGEIAWWQAVTYKQESPLVWMKTEYINKIKHIDSTLMSVLYKIVHEYNELMIRLSEHEKTNNSRFNTIDATVHQINDRLNRAYAASQTAADEAIKANAGIKALKSEMDEALSRQTTEILRLIRTDSSIGERLKIYEAGVQAVTEQAAKKMAEEITKQAQSAGTEITNQAKTASKGISRRVTIPLGVIAGAFLALQWVITHWDQITKLW
jgi:uncharacterized protein YdcH (DUF465 family)